MSDKSCMSCADKDCYYQGGINKACLKYKEPVVDSKDMRIKELEGLLKEIGEWLPYLNFAQYPSDDEMRKLFGHRISIALKGGKVR